jgi:hypothetical protein
MLGRAKANIEFVTSRRHIEFKINRGTRVAVDLSSIGGGRSGFKPSHGIRLRGAGGGP